MEIGFLFIYLPMFPPPVTGPRGCFGSELTIAVGCWVFCPVSLAWRCQEARGGSPQLPRLETGVKAAQGHAFFTSPRLGQLLSWVLRGGFGGRGVFLVDAGKALLF